MRKRHSQTMPEVVLPDGYEPPSAAVGPRPKPRADAHSEGADSTSSRQEGQLTAHLLSRSASYWRDATAFREMGDVPMAVAYETISRELREAAQFDGGGIDG